GRDDGDAEDRHRENRGGAAGLINSPSGTALRSHPRKCGSSGLATTLAPSINACASANGISRRSRRYSNVSKIENGIGDSARKTMNFGSKVNGMTACCDDHAN